MKNVSCLKNLNSWYSITPSNINANAQGQDQQQSQHHYEFYRQEAVCELNRRLDQRSSNDVGAWKMLLKRDDAHLDRFNIGRSFPLPFHKLPWNLKTRETYWYESMELIDPIKYFQATEVSISRNCNSLLFKKLQLES